MGLNSTPSGERVHIAFFGRTNAGKSSLINAITNQELSLVSEISGTTTDPVKKAMELLPIGPVVIIDTPGLDDKSELGEKRIKRAYEVLSSCDVAVLVAEGELSEVDREIIAEFEKREIPYLICYNKADLGRLGEGILVSAKTGEGIEELKKEIAKLVPKTKERFLISDKLSEGDFALLVIPIDDSAPKGRIILPQQQTIRDILDKNANVVATKPEELSKVLEKLGNLVKVVICDSQVFKMVEKIVPKEIFLTSFSILFARYKGDLLENLKGAKALDTLSDGDRVLISEACTHHRQCGDIGRDKLPRMILGYTKKDLEFSFTSGGEFPEDLSPYKLIVHCGACMITETEMKNRISRAKEQNIPITNYGMTIAKTNGILDRSLEIFEGDF